MALILAIGAALRLAEYLACRPVWGDEAMLALNIGRRSAMGLLRPLDYDQGAPPLFLLLYKAVTAVAGMGPCALRFLPFLAGMALPWLVWRSGKALAGTGAGLIAAALTAVSVPLLRYTAEAKQYGVDAFVCAVLLALTLRVRSRPERAAPWWQLLAAGIVAMTLSFTSPFVLGGAFLGLGLDSRVRLAPLGRRRLALLGTAYAAGFGALFLLVYRPQTDNGYMMRYWGETFLRVGAPNLRARFYEAAHGLTHALPLPDALPVTWWVVLVVVGTAVIAFGRGLASAAQVAIPFLALVAGSLIAPYPIADRLLLFVAPLSIIAAGALIACLFRVARLSPAGTGITGALLVMAWGLPRVIGYWHSSSVLMDPVEPARELYRLSGADPVYVSRGSMAVWSYYSTDWSHPDLTRLEYLARWKLRATDSHGVRPLLLWRSNDRTDIVGALSGLEYVERGGYRDIEPDSGWAEREVGRIRALGRPLAWLYGSEAAGREIPVLEAELARQGIVATEVVHGRKSVVLRLKVPVDSSSPLGRSGPP